MTKIIIGMIIATLALGIWLFVRNYKECKSADFTTIYCLTTNN